MQVKMITRYASAETSAAPGQVVTVSEAEGKALVAGGYAVAVHLRPLVEEGAPGMLGEAVNLEVPKAGEAEEVKPEEEVKPKGRPTK